MNNDELKKKICDIIAPYVSAYGDDERIADALIAAGIGDVAKLRERLKAREKSVCFGREWKAVVTDEDIDEVFGVVETRLAELKGDSGGKNADKT